MTNINLDGEAMQAVVSKAILEGISQDQKLSLVEQAINYLVTAPPAPAYGRTQPTPLQSAFNRAVEAVSTKVVMEIIQAEELDAAIREGCEKAIRTNLAENPGWLYGTISESIMTVVRDRLENGSHS